jgi:hypothetical protein
MRCALSPSARQTRMNARTIWALVDANSVVSELSETNNAKSLPYTVQP